mmetsp:Transcript_91105/g.260155  ORF Transcript_91105/g.260155 Transcript_91105/m.260155 type:complete len:211 (+) Transcript_91105:2254-2886(+)
MEESGRWSCCHIVHSPSRQVYIAPLSPPVRVMSSPSTNPIDVMFLGGSMSPCLPLTDRSGSAAVGSSNQNLMWLDLPTVTQHCFTQKLAATMGGAREQTWTIVGAPFCAPSSPTSVGGSETRSKTPNVCLSSTLITTSMDESDEKQSPATDRRSVPLVTTESIRLNVSSVSKSHTSTKGIMAPLSPIDATWPVAAKVPDESTASATMSSL